MGPRRQGRARSLVHHWHYLSATPPGIRADVVTCHGNEVLDQGKRSLVRRSLGKASVVTTPSKFTRDLLAENFSEVAGKISVIPPSVSLRGHKARLTSMSRSDGTVVIGTLSRLVPRKNILRVVEAAVVVAEELDRPVEFHLAGDGPDRDQILSAMRRAPITTRYWGEVSEEDKWSNFLPLLDAFVLPTLAMPADVEGFGIVYLEANAAGTPVIAARSGGSEDAVSDHLSGEFAEPDDVSSIARHIMSVVAGGEVLRRSARAWAERFAPENTARAFADVYGACRIR
ncbi:glycosyltransferase family 4 protein [Nocardioides sp. AX2bis]|uniref:glycosyltransferase family 4 protein n=1 Tax=Nocardioides sp. AX2bis TaxID=2653157 RepID=UPI003FA5B2D8